MQIDDDIILLDKAVKWLKNNIYAGFDSMCLDFRDKESCIDAFIRDMKDSNYGKSENRDYYDGWY